MARDLALYEAASQGEGGGDQYNDGAEDFWEGTRGHDVSQNIATLLQYIEGDPPFTLLDFGCGPGRDLKAFADRRHLAIGLDGAARFTAMACSMFTRSRGPLKSTALPPVSLPELE
jgi:hypothetical protein